MRLPRSSGVLLHPTSLPGRFGVGDLGPGALDLVEALAETGQRWWQVLPLGPTGYGNSPYQSYSSCAGNPLLISPERLAEQGWLSEADWADYPPFPEDRVDFDAVIVAKDALLRRAFARAKGHAKAFRAFTKRHSAWLDDYALFMALKKAHGGAAWYDWDPALVRRDPKTLAAWRAKLEDEVQYVQFVQFVFDEQWQSLRAECQARSIQLLGDLPIFVAQDSADVWSRPDLFCLDERGRPTVIAGVPPDAFAATGQLWGNPLYRWEAHAGEGFAWWISRIRSQTERVDLLRLDHFRGFEAYWEVPAGSPTAETGRWVPAPGIALMDAVQKALGGLPLVAEDLGDITDAVYALRDRYELPGMRVVQFGLGGEPGTEFHLPFTYVNHCLAYTGTHDNDTTVGWFTERPQGDAAERAYQHARREHGRRVVGSASMDEVHWDVIRATLASVADTVIIPLQDILGLGSAARMNVPGNPKGNWTWRFRPGQFRVQCRAQLAEMTAVYSRWNGSIPDRFAPPRPPGRASAEPHESEGDPSAVPTRGAGKGRPKARKRKAPG